MHHFARHVFTFYYGFCMDNRKPINSQMIVVNDFKT